MRLALVLAGLAACARPPTPVQADPLPALSPAQVAARLPAGGLMLYDVNPRTMYEHGHLPGASWAPFNAITRELLPTDPHAELVFYCANELCTASDQAARAAKDLGFDRVSVMPAGYFGWRRAGLPVVEPPAPEREGGP
jgi:rhodanese-related sulfurtransferase